MTRVWVGPGTVPFAGQGFDYFSPRNGLRALKLKVFGITDLAVHGSTKERISKFIGMLPEWQRDADWEVFHAKR